ncbi:MAG: helix-turn-helix domain-containing protein [Saprospiraceae bacterium]|nr:helix-turn-helix domain-containing protein [Saprospiraceae bacterium]
MDTNKLDHYFCPKNTMIMGKIRSVQLTDTERTQLEDGYHHGPNHQYRMRCLTLLLKSTGLPSIDVSQRTGFCEETINGCMTRWELNKMNSLNIKPGRGRKSILDIKQDADLVREAVKAERQKLSLAKANLEGELGKEFSLKTLKRFLKSLSADTNEYDAV